MRIHRHPLDRASRGDASRFFAGVIVYALVIVLVLSCAWLYIAAGAQP